VLQREAGLTEDTLKVLRKAVQKTSRVSRRHRLPRTIWVLMLLSVLLGKLSFEGRLFMMPNAQTQETQEAHIAVPRARTCVLNTDTHTSTHSHILVRACMCLCI
jgi:hypothetical protein